jgi:DNA polymerase-3 subunit delta
VKVEELEKELAKGRFRPAYLVAGEEPLLRDAALRLLRDHVVEPAAADFNFDRFSGETATAARLTDAVRALPVMAARRLVILDEPVVARRKAASEALTEAILELVKAMDAEDTSVLVVVAAKADKRMRWVKGFKQPAAVVECDAPKKTPQIVKWIRGEAERQEIVLARGSAELLAERIGPQLLLLRNELAKVALLAPPGEPVTPTHVNAAASLVAEESIWDLTDAIGGGQVSAAVGQLGRMLSAGSAPEAVLGALAGHYRRMARLKDDDKTVVSSWMADKLAGQGKRYTWPRLLDCLAAIQQADTGLKGASPLPREMQIEQLVIELAE